MSKASQGLGDAVKGIFNTVHGAGEMIRGTINDSVDKVGEGIASEGKSTEPDEQRKKDLTLDGHAPQDHSATVNEGKDEVTKGIDSMKNAEMSPFTNKKVEETAPAQEAQGYLNSAYQGVCNAATAVTDIFRGNVDSIAAQTGGKTEVEEDKFTCKKLTSFFSNKKDEAHIEAKEKAKEAKEKAKEAKEEAKKGEGKIESKCEKVYDEVKQKAQKTCESAEKTFTEVKTKTVETFDKVGSASKKTFNESFEKIKSIGHCESDEKSKTLEK